MEQKNDYLTRLQIDGFWERYQVDWHLHPDVNILIGENGTGKSTILEILATLIFISNRYSINKTIDYKYESPKGIFIKSILTLVSNQILLFKEIRDKDIVLKLTEPEEIAILNFDILQTFDISIKDTVEKQTELDNKVEKQINYYIDYQLNLNKKIRLWNKNEKEVFAKQRFFIDALNRLFKDKTVDENENKIVFVLTDGKKILPNALSSGEKQMLLIMLKVLCQDEKPFILLLDEPEISMHLRWQYELIHIIRTLNPNCQVIIATHSPSIYTNGWNDKVFYIENILKETAHATNDH